ncbi:MAG: cation diffusion facilitator family transporter, partial [Neisseriaceae bacterium]|nr:cation diffusion facilitator family transporter [Neisseriaceae bacterium]
MNTTDPKTLIERTARRSVWASVVVNLALAVMQITVGLFAHSQALVSDGVHSLSDLLSDIVALFATHFSRQTADDKHPYGHRRFENAASLALGLLLSV